MEKTYPVLIALAIFTIAVDCKKNKQPTTTTTTTNPGTSTGNPGSNGGPHYFAVYYDIYNWKDDTLLGQIPNTALFDTMFAVTVGGKTCIQYHGKQYEIAIFSSSGAPKPLDTNSVFPSVIKAVAENGYNIYAMTYPSKYKKNGALIDQVQAVYIDSNFTNKIFTKVTGSIYKGH